MRVTDVVVAAKSLVRAEGLTFHGRERRLIDIRTGNVPARRESRLVESHRPLRVGDDSAAMADNKVTGCPADVDAVIAIGRMAGDPFILFVEGMHLGPGKRNPSLQFARVCG